MAVGICEGETATAGEVTATGGGETGAATEVIGACVVGAAVWTGTLAGRWARVAGGAMTGACVGIGAAGGGAAAAGGAAGKLGTGADGAGDGGA
jgi:hypothetical protein